MTHPKYDGELPDGWQGGEPVTKYWNGDYIHLYRVMRPCATCGAEISLDVTKKALDGTKKNAGLLLRNCPKCRAERKAGGVGSRGGKSRPVAGDPPGHVVASSADVTEELERLRTANATMKEELDGLYVLLKELRQQQPTPTAVPIVKSAVQPYRLPPEPLTMEQSTKALRDHQAKNNAKMPWEGA
jgi:hypothetical protein